MEITFSGDSSAGIGPVRSKLTKGNESLNWVALDVQIRKIHEEAALAA